MKRVFTLLLCLSFVWITMTSYAQQNVGIGTTAPNDLLHIRNGDLRLENAFAKLKFFSSVNEIARLETNGNSFWISNKFGGPMHFRTNEFPRMTITDAGNIGINETSPQTLLHIVDGHIRFEGNSKFMDLYTSSGSSIGWRFYRDAIFKGGMKFSADDNMLVISNNFNFPGLHYNLFQKHLGVNVMNPEATLHIKDGNIKHESDGDYVDIVSTDSIQTNGIRFYQRNTFKGAIFMNTLTRRLNITNSANNDGLVLNFNNNNTGIQTDSPLDPLHVSGQIRIESSSTPRLKLYNGSTYKAYLQHSGTSLYLSNFDPGFLYLRTNNLSRVAIDGTGKVGIGNNAPDAKLDVLGINNWDLTASEGDFRVGDNNYRIKMGIALDGGGAGTGRIWATGGTNRLILGGGTTDVLAIEGTGEVGIGTNTPGYALDIQKASARSINIGNAYDGTSPKYGININVDANGTGYKYGVYARAYGDNSGNYVYGVRGYASGSGNTGNVYGVYAQTAASGTGNHYGLYTTANLADPSPTTRSFALYAVGHSYFQNDVRIGTLDGAAGYLLSVDGKIMSEELKVQMSGNWPDYVFEPEYNLPTLQYVKNHIAEKGHLPGVPAADQVEAENGFHVGEMNRILLEKVEELTLYILQQEERILKLEDQLLDFEK